MMMATPSTPSVRFPLRALVMLGLAFATGAALDVGTASAQDEDTTAGTDDGGQKVLYKKKTEIDFEGLDVSGELVKPSGMLLLDRKRANFNPLIKLRSDFNEEMSASVDEIK
jgi:hypothetical protein